jgi:hypothetical protein
MAITRRGGEKQDDGQDIADQSGDTRQHRVSHIKNYHSDDRANGAINHAFIFYHIFVNYLLLHSAILQLILTFFP